ncbi:MAG: hypothetical protein V9F06_01520 [Thermomicrobiales bacterium]
MAATPGQDLTERPGVPEGILGKIGRRRLAASPAASTPCSRHEEGGVFRSDDSGETWERTSDDRNLRQRAWYYSHIVADPCDADTVWVLNVELWRSVDGGKTFQQVPAPHGDNHDMWIDPTNTDRMILGNDGGDDGHLQRRRLVVYPLQPADRRVLPRRHRHPDALPRLRRAAGQHDDVAAQPVELRRHHHQRMARDRRRRERLHRHSPRRPRYRLRRLDAGLPDPLRPRPRAERATSAVWPENFHRRSLRPRHEVPLPVDLADRPLAARPDTPATSARNYVFRTTNEGQSAGTSTQPRPDPRRPGDAGLVRRPDHQGQHRRRGTTARSSPSPSRRLRPGVIWTGSDDGLVHVTRDGGADMAADVSPTGLPDWALMLADRRQPARRPDRPTLAATRYKLDDFAPYLFRTTDGGKTWTTITNGIPHDDFTRVVREDPKRRGMLYAGTETGIYISWTTVATRGSGWAATCRSCQSTT